MSSIYVVISIIWLLVVTENIFAYLPTINYHKISIHKEMIENPICKSLYAKKITPNQGESIEQYRKAVLEVLKSESTSSSGKLGGRELLELIIKKWGVAYDIQLRKSKPFGDGSENLYINVMWRYFGQKSFPMNEREYLEHLEAIGRYITAMNKVTEFKEKVAEIRKRPNSYFGYAVPIPLNVDPDTADAFFKDLTYD